MRRIVPFGTGVTFVRCATASPPSCFGGIESVCQNSCTWVPSSKRPGRGAITESIETTALPFASWPVTTRLMLNAMDAPLLRLDVEALHDRAPVVALVGDEFVDGL